MSDYSMQINEISGVLLDISNNFHDFKNDNSEFDIRRE